MSVHSDISSFIKMRGLLSAISAALLLFSTGALAVKNGPACVLPGTNGLTEEQWAKAQDAVPDTGHLFACHIDKSVGWLKERTEGAHNPPCTAKPVVSSWTAADVMWKHVGAQITTFCNAAENGQTFKKIYTTLRGDGRGNVGYGYDSGDKPYAFAIADDRQAVTILNKKQGEWYVLTSYPMQ